MSGFTAINWGTPLLLLAIYGGVRYFMRPAINKKDSYKLNWSALESVSITLAIYFSGQVFAAAMAYTIPWLLGEEDIAGWLSISVYGQFLLSLLVYTMWGLLLFWFIKRRGSDLYAVGFVKPKLNIIWYVLAGFGVYFITSAFLLSIVGMVVPQFNEDQKQIVGFEGASGLHLPMVFISLVVLPPLIEEFMMRGFTYSGLKKNLNIFWAYVITSGLFAIAHLQAGMDRPLLWSAAVDTFVLSLILIYLREKTGSLWTSIGLHGLKNFIAFLGLFVFHWV
jgi:membrane protease YdiL (CAAX protease family)